MQQEPHKSLTGLVVKAQSGFFTVQTDHGRYVCKLPKRLIYRKQKAQQKDEELTSALVAVGDTVVVHPLDATTGAIEAVLPRRRVLSRTRPAPADRRVLQDREQVLIANPDQVVFVFAIAEPEPSLRKLDRFLVAAERYGLPAVIVVNKIDLTGLAAAEALFGLYATLGYAVIYTSVVQQIGIDALRACLTGRISVLTGSSGVGKSSLLNAVQPGLGLQVSEVSAATQKGMHTTRFTELIPLEGGGYVADTPGIRALALFDIEAGELDAYFREIAPLVAHCEFSDCTHRREPGCAVRAAVADGRIAAQRYESYLRLRDEHDSLHRGAYG